MKIELHFQDIQKIYHEKSLYNQLTGIIPGGACTCITGDNGSGKSTFLKIMASLIRPSSGEFFYKENEHSLSVPEARCQMAFLAPEMQLYDTLSAAENLLFFAGISNVSLSADRIVDLLETVELSIKPTMPLYKCSTGMKQRLKLALLLATDKKIWFLDEPSSNLDDKGRTIVKKLIQRATATEHTILLATNEPSEVTYADTVYHLT